MRELGADHTIDYKTEHIGEAAKRFRQDGIDLIFECAIGDTLRQSLQALKRAVKLVSILNHGQELDKTIDFTCLFVEPNSKLLDHLCELVETGKLKALVSKNYSLNEAAEALKHIQTQHTKGKMVKVI